MKLDVTWPTTCAVDADRRCPPVGAAPSHGEAEQPPVVGERGGALERAHAEEVGLVHLHRPVHAEAARRGVELGVHADDDVALLEPQAEQRLQAVGLDAEVAPRPPSAPATARPSDRAGGGARSDASPVKLQPHHVARHAGDRRRGRAAGTSAGRRGRAGCSSSPASGPGDVDGRQRHRAVEHVHPSPHVSIQSRTHISAFAAPPDVNVSDEARVVVRGRSCRRR